MPDPFGFDAAIANSLGVTVEYAGYLLGSVLVVSLWISLQMILSVLADRDDSMVTFSSLIVAVVVTTLIGWFPPWVPFLIVVTLFLIYWLSGMKD